MRLHAIAAVTVVLAAAATGHAGPPPAPSATPPAPTPTNTKHVSANHTFVPTHRAVTWSYFQLHHPQLVASVLRDVAAGKTPRSTVATLAPPTTLDKLLKTTFPARASAGTVVRGGPPKGQTKSQAAVAKPSEWGAMTNALAGIPEYTPSKLAFPTAYDKDVKRMTVWLTATADSHFTATLPTGAPFRIKEIVSYDGSIEITGLGPMMKPWDWRKVAPFELSVHAGQLFAVIVEFAPEFAIGTMMAGQKTGMLEIADDKHKVKVPLSGMFNGIHIAGVVLSTESEVTAPTYYLPAQHQRFTTKVSVFNLGADARTATITADALPAGVTLDGLPTVSLAPGETKHVDVGFFLDGASYGYGEGMMLRASAPGGLTSTAYLGLNIVPDVHTWELKGDTDGIWFDLVWRLDAAGYWNIMATEMNESSLFGWDLEYKLDLGNWYTGGLVRPSLGNRNGDFGPKIQSQAIGWKDTGPERPYGAGWKTDYYADSIHRPAKITLHMESRP